MRYTSIVFILSFAFLGTVSSMGIVHTVSLDAKLGSLRSEVMQLQYEVQNATKSTAKNDSQLAYNDGPVEISIISPVDSKDVCRGDKMSIAWINSGLREVGVSVVKEKSKGVQIGSVPVQTGKPSEFLWDAGMSIQGEELPDGEYSVIVSGANGQSEFATDISLEPIILKTCS